MDRILTMAALALAAVSAPLPAIAQVYRWTDERGVVNYTSSPPPKGVAGVQVTEPERGGAPQLTPSAPPPPDLRPGARGPERSDTSRERDALRDRVGALERELEGARREQVAAAQADDDRRRRVREECERQRRVDCDQVQDLPANPQVIVAPRVRRTNPAIGPTLPVPEKKPPPERARINTAPKAAGAPQ